MKKFKGIIYQAINIQNRKSYIGKTTQDFEEYKQEHIDSALKNIENKKGKRQKYFYVAIRIYGEHNFKWIVLGEIQANSKKELNKQLNEAEIECIWLFRTYGLDGINKDSIYGYNCTKGGDGGDTLSNHPDKEIIFKTATENRLRTLKQNPDIGINIGKKISISWKNKSQEDKDNIIQKQKDKISNRSEEEWDVINKKIKDKEVMTKIEKEIIIGSNNPRYTDIDYEFIIKEYFNNISKNNLILKYNECHSIKLSSSKYEKFLKILNLIHNCSKKYRPKKYENYTTFIENNKTKIDWYIENYKNLEKIFFKNLHYEKHKDIFTNINKINEGSLNE